MHECPFCYEYCHCHGDIDDICLDAPDDCSHYMRCENREDVDDDWPVDEQGFPLPA
jgi:hypothetical protein